MTSRSLGATAFFGLALAAVSISSCRRKEAAAPPMATPSVTLSRDKVPLGGPVDITYKFVVAPDAKFAQDYSVMVHVVHTKEELIWPDEHHPPIPLTTWSAGQPGRVENVESASR